MSHSPSRGYITPEIAGKFPGEFNSCYGCVVSISFESMEYQLWLRISHVWHRAWHIDPSPIGKKEQNKKDRGSSGKAMKKVACDEKYKEVFVGRWAWRLAA